MLNESDRSRRSAMEDDIEANGSARLPSEGPGPQRPVPVNPAVELGRRGGAARARRLTSERRSEIARNAAARRWGKEAT